MKRADCATMTDSIILEDKTPVQWRLKEIANVSIVPLGGGGVEMLKTYTFYFFNLIENL